VSAADVARPSLDAFSGSAFIHDTPRHPSHLMFKPPWVTREEWWREWWEKEGQAGPEFMRIPPWRERPTLATSLCLRDLPEKPVGE